MTNDRRFAVVSKYFNDRGFGWLVETTPTKKVQHFFHISGCVGFVPEEGQVVSFTVGVGKKGPAAVGVELCDPTTAGALGAIAGEGGGK